MKRRKTEKDKNMAKYNVSCTCGHNRHCEILGKHSERQRRLDWYSTQECAACWLRGQGKFGAAATAARESGETELYEEIMEQAKGRRRDKPEEKPLGATPGHLSNAELSELGL